MRTKLTAIALGVAATASLVFAPTARADTPLCSGHGCYGKDPNNEHCTTGAYAVGSATIRESENVNLNNDSTGFGYLHLMYSPSCNSNWAEFDNYPRGYRFALVAWNNVPQSQIPVEKWTSNGDEVAWTDMVDGTYFAGVAVCQDSASTGAVVNHAFMVQTNGEDVICQAGQTWVLEGRG